MKLKKWTWEERWQEGYQFMCPGCGHAHSICTKGPTTWYVNNNDPDKPIIHPSVLVTYPANPDASDDFAEWRTERICHSFIGHSGAQPGQIIFLSDSTHALSGKVVDLPDWPYDENNELSEP